MLKHELRPAKGSNKKKKRVGRGTGSGLGTTAGKGHKGQKARAGAQPIRGFEGGQTPMIRRAPKRGFSNVRFATVYEIVNLGAIEEVYSAGEEVNLKSLRAHNLVHGNKDGIKILADGEFTKKLKFNVDKVSKTAVAKISETGGSIKLISPYVENAEVKARKEARRKVKEAKVAKKANKAKK